MLLKKMLQIIGCSVDTASDGREAVSKYKSNVFDLIFMDIRMPEMDGLEATREIRKIESEENREQITIVALTASVAKEDLDLSVEAGCDGFLSKPVNLNKITECLIDKSFLTMD